MRRTLSVVLLAGIAAGCDTTTDPGPVQRTVEMHESNLQLEWGIVREQELACGGGEIAGGGLTGQADISPFGSVAIEITSAWDIGARIADPAEAEFSPEGPAGGPFAPVFGQEDYPYSFRFNPFTGQCGNGPVATGDLVLTAGDGRQVYAVVTGGETHRLDFVLEGDGIETFATVEVQGGTDIYQTATGSLVLHTIVRFDFTEMRFVIDLAAILPGGTVTY